MEGQGGWRESKLPLFGAQCDLESAGTGGIAGRPHDFGKGVRANLRAPVKRRKLLDNLERPFGHVGFDVLLLDLLDCPHLFRLSVNASVYYAGQTCRGSYI
jgi:hypothetical protein